VVRTFSQRGDDDATRIVLYTVIAFAYREGTATTGGRQTRLFEPRQDATLAALVDDDETGTRHFTDARAPVGRPGDRAECVAILYADETAPERPAQQYVDATDRRRDDASSLGRPDASGLRFSRRCAADASFFAPLSSGFT
jgi:hypothetical protein